MVNFTPAYIQFHLKAFIDLTSAPVVHGETLGSGPLLTKMQWQSMCEGLGSIPTRCSSHSILLTTQVEPNFADSLSIVQVVGKTGSDLLRIAPMQIPCYFSGY